MFTPSLWTLELSPLQESAMVHKACLTGSGLMEETLINMHENNVFFYIYSTSIQ